jgi:hypothetical protein
MGLTKQSRCANLGVATRPILALFRQLLFGLRALAFGDAGALCIQEVLRGGSLLLLAHKVTDRHAQDLLLS